MENEKRKEFLEFISKDPTLELVEREKIRQELDSRESLIAFICGERIILEERYIVKYDDVKFEISIKFFLKSEEDEENFYLKICYILKFLELEEFIEEKEFHENIFSYSLEEENEKFFYSILKKAKMEINSLMEGDKVEAKKKYIDILKKQLLDGEKVKIEREQKLKEEIERCELEIEQLSKFKREK